MKHCQDTPFMIEPKASVMELMEQVEAGSLTLYFGSQKVCIRFFSRVF